MIGATHRIEITEDALVFHVLPDHSENAVDNAGGRTLSFLAQAREFRPQHFEIGAAVAFDPSGPDEVQGDLRFQPDPDEASKRENSRRSFTWSEGRVLGEFQDLLDGLPWNALAQHVRAMIDQHRAGRPFGWGDRTEHAVHVTGRHREPDFQLVRDTFDSLERDPFCDPLQDTIQHRMAR